MTPLEIVGLAVCVAALVALRIDSSTPDGMPSRRQRRMWARERADINPALKR